MRPLTFYLTVAVLVATDQVSKWSVTRTVPATGQPVVPGVFSLTPTQNTGGAFSLLQAHNSVFLVIAAVAILALLLAYHYRRHEDMLVCAALALALGGAIGNVIDRAAFGYVRDFFHVHDLSGNTLWPIFNIADSAITVSVVLLAWRALRPSRAQSDGAAMEPDGPGAAPGEG